MIKEKNRKKNKIISQEKHLFILEERDNKMQFNLKKIETKDCHKKTNKKWINQ